jgi:hypothetical protein
MVKNILKILDTTHEQISEEEIYEKDYGPNISDYYQLIKLIDKKLL